MKIIYASYQKQNGRKYVDSVRNCKKSTLQAMWWIS